MKKELNSMYEVSRDEYAGFLDQIKPECRETEIIGRGEPYTELNVFSKDKMRHFATCTIQSIEDEDRSEEKYYVFDMPLDEERQEPRRIRKIVLETKEEVQAFIDILAKIQKEKNNND